MQLVLSLFSNIGMLDMGFTQNGFCVVSAGDTILGSHHDIRNFNVPSNKFNGVIGGSPCQDFSKARRTPPTGEGNELLNEFKRVVLQASPDWFLLENVPECPDIEIEGYKVQRFNLNAKHCGSSQNRNRKFQFGSKQGLVLQIIRDAALTNVTRCVTASEFNKIDRRKFSDFCLLQGLPVDFDLPSFNLSGKYRAVGNGVNILVAYKVAKSIREATQGDTARRITDYQFCVCGCGEEVKGKQISKTSACRKRIQIKRERAAVNAPS
jgi:DNA (cytosine-5)-methyltransferase 1